MTKSATGPGFLVRPFEAGDRPGVLDLLAQLAAWEARFEADRSGDPHAAAMHLDDMVNAAEQARGAVLVAATTDGARPIALATVLFRVDEPFIHETFRKYVFICDLFVAESWRRRGVGGALFLEIQHLARKRGIRRVGVGALARNLDADAAYTSWGLRPYAVEYVMDLETAGAEADG